MCKVKMNENDRQPRISVKSARVGGLARIIGGAGKKQDLTPGLTRIASR